MNGLLVFSFSYMAFTLNINCSALLLSRNFVCIPRIEHKKSWIILQLLNPFECFRVWILLRCPAKANIRLESSTMNAWLSSCALAEGARFQINILLIIAAVMVVNLRYCYNERRNCVQQQQLQMELNKFDDNSNSVLNTPTDWLEEGWLSTFTK